MQTDICGDDDDIEGIEKVGSRPVPQQQPPGTETMWKPEATEEFSDTMMEDGWKKKTRKIHKFF